MNIITISREFGSGGRELGSLIAKKLGYDYYDSKIITFLSDAKKCDELYVDNVLDNHTWHTIPIITHDSFIAYSYDYTGLLVEQKNVIEDIAKKGKDFVIVGKNADLFLNEYNPFKLFVCADYEYRVNRCVTLATREEEKNPKYVAKMIKTIDKKRKRTREIISDDLWGNPVSYDVCVNTTNKDLEKVADEIVALYKERISGN